MKRVLIINPFGVGDCLFADPVVTNLKKAYPDLHISYIANNRTAEFIKLNPNINNVIIYERDDFVVLQSKNFFHFSLKWVRFINEIRKAKYDVVFDFSLNRMFGFITWVSGIPKRIGYDFKKRGMFLTHKIKLIGYEVRHVIEFYLDLLKFVDVPVVENRMRLHVSKPEEIWAGEWLHRNQVKNISKIIAIIPGGGASWGGNAAKKRWPAVKYAQLIDKIVAETSATVILFGDAKEEGLAQEITRLAGFPVHSAVGQTSIVQMVALLKYCIFAIVNDGGPLHVAVASGVKTLSIFGPVDDLVYGPYPAEGHQVVKANLACQPCYKRFVVARCSHLSCLQDLSVDAVYRKVNSIYEYSVH